MENRAFALTVGIVSLLLALAMAVAFWWLSGDRQAMRHYVVLSPLPVTGLNAESVVKYRGVDVGKVTQISLSDASQNTIVVDMQVLETLHLSKQTYAELHMQGITGLAYINLNDEQPNGVALASTDKIPLHASTLDKMLDAAPQLAAKVDTLLTNSNKLAVSANQVIGALDQKNLNETISNIEKASQKIEPLLDNANKTLDRLSSVASPSNVKQLNETMLSVKTSADAILPMSKSMTETSISFNKTASDFSQMAAQIQTNTAQVTSTLNDETLPLLNTFTQAATEDLNEANKVIRLLEDNPQSLIFGSPVAQPGPGEAGFTFKP